MKELIYTDNDTHVFLTTESPMSSYGMPILRFEDVRKNCNNNSPLEYSVEDMLANGMTARELVLLYSHSNQAKLWNQSTKEIVEKFLNLYRNKGYMETAEESVESQTVVNSTILGRMLQSLHDHNRSNKNKIRCLEDRLRRARRRITEQNVLIAKFKEEDKNSEQGYKDWITNMGNYIQFEEGGVRETATGELVITYYMRIFNHSTHTYDEVNINIVPLKERKAENWDDIKIKMAREYLSDIKNIRGGKM